MKERDENKLEEAICGLAGMIGQLVRELSHINKNNAILQRLAEMEERIMSRVTDFAVAQKAYNDRQAIAIDNIVASQAGITGDVAELKRLIEELQNSPGGITPEDQALLDELQATGEAATAKLEAQAAALAALDEATPPVVPPTPA